MINRVHERALRVTLGDDLSDYESLLQNNRDIRSHHKNIQSLMKKKEKRTAHYGIETLNYWSPHNYGLFYQKTLRKLSYSKFLRGKQKTGSVTIVSAGYVKVTCKILDFFKVIYIATIYNVLF